MTTSEGQANLETVTAIMIVFGSLVRIPFDYRSSKSLICTSFALHVDRKLSPLKHKLVVTTALGEQILRNFVFNGCEILIEGVVVKANLILLEIHEFEIILDMDWLPTHRASVDCFCNTPLEKST